MNDSESKSRGEDNSVVGTIPSNSNGTLIGQVTTTSIQKLNGKNFLPWKRQVMIVLELRGLKRALITDDVDSLVQGQATLVLLETMDDGHKLQVSAEPTARAIMKNLERQYANTSEVSQHRMLSNFMRYVKNPEDNLSQHINRLMEMRAALTNFGQKQTEEMFQVVLINSLPNEFGDVMRSWELVHPDQKNTEFLLNYLQQREEDFKKVGDSGQVLLMDQRRRNQSQNRMTIEERKRITKCHECGDYGHWARECPNKGRKKVTQDSGTTETEKTNIMRYEVNFNVGANGLNLLNEWIIDSGATSHMANNSEWFCELMLYETPKVCAAGDGYNLKVLGEGKVSLDCIVGKSVMKMVLNNVLFMPELTTNLISVGKAANQDVTTVFMGDQCKFMCNKQVIAVGVKLNEQLYQLSIKKNKRLYEAMLMVKKAETMADYHRVFGHAGVARIKKLLKDLDIPVPTDDHVSCPECPSGKGHHASHPLTNRLEAKPGVVHVDVAHVKNKTSLKGFRYYLLCKDECSEFVFVYPCESTSEVPKLLARLVIDFEVISGSHIRQVHSDNGREFNNRTVEALWLKEGIQHHFSAPYCPQQNGRIEREVQTITDSARTILTASKLPKELWPEAVHTAVYLKNRLPTARSDITPLERLTGRKPSIEHLVEFGRQVHVLVNGEYLTKLDPRTREGFVVGFTQRRNTYQVYLPCKNKVIVTCDVIFANHGAHISGQLESTTRAYGDEAGILIPRNNGWEPTFMKGKQTTGGKKLAHIEPANPERDSCHDNVERPPDLSSNSDQTGAKSPPTLESENNHSQSDCDLYYTTREPRSSTPLDTSGLDEQSISKMRMNLSKYFDELLERHRNGEFNESIESGPNLTQGNEERAPTPPPRLSSTQGLPSAPIYVPDRDLMQSFSVADGARSNLTQRDDSVHFCLLTPQMLCEPSSYLEATTGPMAEEWKKAIASELSAHEVNQTWCVVERPCDQIPLTTKWVFTIKRDSVGAIERFKARLVARGFEQKFGVDFVETFAPVARIESLRVLLALATINKWGIKQFDVSTAFLNGVLEEHVLIEPPKGVDIKRNLCLKLNKALYGLKQAPKCWNSTFDRALKDLKLVPTESDPCVYVNKDMCVIIYVDDGLVMGRDETKLVEFLMRLEQRFTIKELSGNKFLGMDLERTNNSIRISQTLYVEDILERFNMKEANGVSTPITTTKHLFDAETMEISTFPYLQAIGSLQYLASRTRPDILFAVNFLSTFNKSYGVAHWTAVKRVLKYLVNTKTYGITYSGSIVDIRSFCDADFANDERSRKSKSGAITLLASGPVTYCSTKQNGVAQSSTQAEYVAANEAVKDIAWLTSFLQELGVTYKKPQLFVDNRSTIKQIENKDTRKKSKHVDIKYHYIRQQHKLGKFEIKSIATEDQVADFLTKPLAGPQLNKLLSTAGVGPKMAANIALILVSLITVCAATSYHFQETEPLIWTETEHRVDIGVSMGNIDFSIISPCELYQPDLESPLNTKNISYSSLYHLCDQTFKQEVVTAFEELASCITPRANKLPSRVKREIVTLLSLLAASVVAGGGASAYTYWNSDSSYNRLNAIDKLNTERDSLMQQLKASLKKAQDDLSDFKTKMDQQENTITSNKEEANQLLQQAKEIRGQTITIASEHHEYLVQLSKAVVNLAQTTAGVSWDAGRLNYLIHSDRDKIFQLTGSCRKGRFNAQVMYQLTKLPELRDLDEENTFLESVSLVRENTVNFRFVVSNQAKDTKVFKAVAFPHWVNQTSNNPVLINWNGPKFALYNATSDCLVGIDDIKDKRVFKNCVIPGHTDPRLKDSWEQVTNVDEEATLPVIYKSGMFSYIHCWLNNITIAGRERFCPPFTFKVPIQESWSLPTSEHNVSKLILHLQERVVPISKLALLNKTEVDYDRTYGMIRDLQLKNDRSGPIKIEYDGNIIKITKEGIAATLTIIGAVVTVIGGFCKLIC